MIDPDRSILLSIRPRFAEAILAGTKTVELRRTPPRLDVPTEVLLYASQPTCAIVGTCRVDKILAYTPAGLWRLIGRHTGVTHGEFKLYFQGVSTAYGLVLNEPLRLGAAVALPALRQTWQGFHPPQSFRYLDRKSTDRVLALAS